MRFKIIAPINNAVRGKVSSMFKSRVVWVSLCSVLATGLIAGTTSVWAARNGEGRSSNVVQMVNVTANLEKTIDAKKSKAGDSIAAKSTEEATLSNGTKVPVGSVLTGHIDSISPSEKKSDSVLVLTFDKLAIKNGPEIPVKTVVVKVSSFAQTFGQEQANNDPDANRPASDSIGGPSSANVIAHPTGDTSGLHPIEGLTLSGCANDSTSGTITQAKKSVHLTNNTQLIVSVAALTK